MSVKIEILDYKYGTGNNLADVNQASSGLSSGWTASSPTNVAWDGSGSGVTFLSNISSQSLVIGVTYNLSFKIYGYTGSGTMGFSTSSGVPSTARFASNTSGVQNFTFIATGTSFPDLFGRSTNTGNISSITITDARVIDWDNSVVGELDVTDHSDFPLAMTFQISDFKDLTSTSGDYSKTFKFPATKNNNNILKHLYIPNINSDNDVTERKPCRIMMGDAYTLLGLIRITGTGGYGEVPSYYSGVFYGNNLTWASGLESAYMNQLAWGVDGENLTYNKTSIMATWQDVDCNSNPNSYIVYPITSYGQYNLEGETRTIQLLDTKYGTGTTACTSCLGYFGFHDSGDGYETPLPNPDWRPAIFVKNTLDKLFSSVGYKISSAFMNTADFKKNVWLLPNFKYNNPDDRFSLYAAQVIFSATSLSTKTITDSSISSQPTWVSSPLSLGTLNTDFAYSSTTASTNISYSSDDFTIAEYGYYNLTASNWKAQVHNVTENGSSSFAYNETLGINTFRLAIQVQTVGQVSWNNVVVKDLDNEVVGAYAGDFAFWLGKNPLVSIDNDSIKSWKDLNEVGVWLNKNDKLRVVISAKWEGLYGGVGGDWSVDITPKTENAKLNIELDPNNVEYGQTYNLTDVMNPDYKQIDFIKGIAHSYNLQMTTDESTKTVYIEPFDSFYKPYKDAIDWTSKVSRGEEISDKWIQNDLKRDLVFKYKSDSADAKVKVRGETYFDDVEDEYPYRETLPTTFEKGDSTFENPFFAGTYSAKNTNTTGIPNVDTAYSACLWTGNHSPNDSGRTNKGFEFLPRLLHWNKYSPANGSGTKIAKVQTWSSITNWITADAAASPTYHLSTIYPQATMINRDSTTSPILSYGNVWVRDYDDATGVYTAYQTGRGLYDTYYRNMIEMLKINPRLRTVFVDLKVSDIINLDFRELVYIDGVYWRINRIVDYMPNNTTKVELIEWSQIGVFAATAPAFGSSGNSSRNWGVGGSYTVSTSDEAEPINSF